MVYPSYYIALFCVIFCGCTVIDGPRKIPELDNYKVNINFHDSIEEISIVCGKPREGLVILGCARFHGNNCTINVMPDDWNVTIHELQHCFHGKYHKER